ncbi:MAG: type I-C CRISPR-associated protein Cas7/Csd2 [Hyphomonadaceae bacterium]|nr:type I-C CRISPR-associated protein Cas7/Csd2 [Hyphomonadaceae bacterium]
MPAIQNRYEFVYLFEVVNGNPNGDPDAGNQPRLEPDTGKGLVTDVCLKRKVRNFVEMTRNGTKGSAIYMQERSVLNRAHKRSWDEQAIDPDKKGDYSKLPKDRGKAEQLTRWMCANFYDIRAFGAVMTTEVNCGQVRGPVQMAFAQSIDPIVPIEISITRSSVTNEKDIDKERTMGRKHIVPYGLYRAHGFVSASLAERTGFSEDDLKLFWDALKHLFEHDRSAARGEMAARRLIVFKHKDKLGNAPAHKLFEAVRIEPINGAKAARSYADYKDRITIDKAAVPAAVEVVEML